MQKVGWVIASLTQGKVNGRLQQALSRPLTCEEKKPVEPPL